MKKLLQKRKNNKGFSLVELIVVVAIMAVLIGVLVPTLVRNVEKSKKLLCSQVRMGSEVRQIVSGLRPHYTAEEMVGKKVVVVANLKPAKLAGVLSEGMLLCAEDAEGKPVLLTAEKDVPNGVSIG